MFPPATEDIELIGLHREPEEASVTLYLLTGDTYRLTGDELITYLKLLGITEVDLDVASYVWNFYNVLLYVKEKRMESCTFEELKKVMKRFQL